VGNNANTPNVRFSGFSEPWLDYTFNDVISVAERPFEMNDYERYQCVTAKRRNGGIVSRGFFKGSDILVKSQFKIKAGDYLISKRQVVHGANGVVPAVLDDAIVSNEYLVFQESELLNMEFLAILSKLPSMYEAFFLSSNGVHIEKLLFDFEDWLTRNVCIPDKDEQKVIVAFFNNIDETIALKRQQYEQTVSIKKSMLEKMFPKKGADVPETRFKGFVEAWKVKSLGEIAFVNMGQSPDSKNYTDNPLDHILVQGNADIKNGWVIPRVWTTQVTKTAQKGDIIVSVRAPVGDVGKTNYNAVIGRGVAAVRGNEFVYQSLLKMKMFDYWGEFSTGSTFDSITSSQLINTEIIAPCEKEQAAIGIFFYNLDILLEAQREELEKLQNIKNACLSKMFV